MKIAIVVQGRFHAFDLARALSDRGHQVTLFTNYPVWAAKRYGVGNITVKSFRMHGIASRIAGRLGIHAESELHSAFGRWAARKVGRESWDVIHCWSGVSLELLRANTRSHGMTALMRGSAHIRTQSSILEEEERRTGVALDRPSAWMIEREVEEYKRADKIVTLSSFASKSFTAEGISDSKLLMLPLGADCGRFRPKPEIVEARRKRILSGAPLRVLYVGAISFRKGMQDAAALVRILGHENFHFRFVGPVMREATALVREISPLASFKPKQAQHDLPKVYEEGDVFFTPTLEDGFAVVLSQAQASALPLLSTTNCGGPDLISEGETGWILPPHSPELFAERLRWCQQHREELAAMIERLYNVYQVRDWSHVASDFERMCMEINLPGEFAMSSRKA